MQQIKVWISFDQQAGQVLGWMTLTAVGDHRRLLHEAIYQTIAGARYQPGKDVFFSGGVTQAITGDVRPEMCEGTIAHLRQQGAQVDWLHDGRRQAT